MTAICATTRAARSNNSGTARLTARTTSTSTRALATWSGFTSRQLRPDEFRDLPSYGIGLDDVYDNPGALRERLESARPRAVCFNSSEALRRFAGRDKLSLP
jgi:hypothetical protein